MKENNYSLFMFPLVIFLITSSFYIYLTGQGSSLTNDMYNDVENNLVYLCKEKPGYFNEQRYERLTALISNSYNITRRGISLQGITRPESLSGLANSDWPMKCHDTHHTGRSQFSTVNNSYAELWSYRTESWMDTNPAIGPDGIIYVGGAWNCLLAFFPNGTIKWSYETGGLVGACPAIADDGIIYFTSWDHYLHAIYPNGTSKWRFDSHSVIDTSPAIAEDGTIYFGTMSPDNDIVAVNPIGTVKWRCHTGFVITSDPAIGDDGTVYIGSGDGYVYALYPNNGSVRWRYHTGDEVKGEPSIGPDGTIYIGSWDGYLYAFYPDGRVKWRTSIGLGTASNPSLGNDGIIYISGYYTMYAIYASNGTQKWAIDLGGHADSSSPAISADGTIYIGVEIGDGKGGDIIAINPDGSERWRKRIGSSWVESSPCIASDGTLYVCSSSFTTPYGWGQLHAFGYGPMEVDAYGPYQGYLNQPVQFDAYAAGGDPPYTYHWDFGDGNVSYEKNPVHNYSQVGIYNATFTLIDIKQNHSSDSTTVAIRCSPPLVSITRPGNGIYLFDINIFPWYTVPVVIGRITVNAAVEQQDLLIDRVEFYFDGKLQGTVTTEPYRFTIKARSFSTIDITVIAYDIENNYGSSTKNVLKFF